MFHVLKAKLHNEMLLNFNISTKSYLNFCKIHIEILNRQNEIVQILIEMLCIIINYINCKIMKNFKFNEDLLNLQD